MIARVDPNVRRVGITGLGVRVPDRILTNDELEKMVETSDEWIVTRTGIRERRIARDDEAASDLAIPAARQALERAGIEAAELDVVIVATSTPDMLFPTTAVIVAEALGAKRAAAYDTLAACSGFLYSTSQAYGLIAGGVATKALVIGSETLSKIVDWTDRGTCILFGDGAGAVVMEPVESGGFHGFELGVDGSHGADLCLPGGGSRNPASPATLEQGLQWVHMNGQLLAEVGATVDEIDLYVPHQANQRIVDHAVKHLGLPPEKVFSNIDRFGNTSAASIPLGLADAHDQGRLQPGMNVLMSAVGGGLTWGSAYMTWSGPKS